MSIEGYRKIISLFSGVVGIVLVSWLGVPRETIETLTELFVSVLPQIAAIGSILAAVWHHITKQAEIDEAKVKAGQVVVEERGLNEFPD